MLRSRNADCLWGHSERKKPQTVGRREARHPLRKVAGFERLRFFLLAGFYACEYDGGMIAMSAFPGVTTQEAAEIIGCSDANVRILLLSGKIKGQKLGRDWRVDERSAKAYAAIQPKTGRPRRVQNS